MNENKERIKRIFILLLIVALIMTGFFLIKSNIYKKGELTKEENLGCINYFSKCLCLGTTKKITECLDNNCGPTQYKCEGWEICSGIDEIVCS